jgi:hypothetical protein
MRRVSVFLANSALVIACSGSGSRTSVTGAAVLTFTPVFSGSATTSGNCLAACGPASYHALVILVTDDPGVESQCAADAIRFGESFNPKQYHYLTITTVSADPIAAGTYVISASGDETTYASVDVNGPSSGTLGFWDYANPSGNVQITGLYGGAQGSFTASGFYGPDDATVGALSGTFDAPSCTALAGSAGVCGACPG